MNGDTFVQSFGLIGGITVAVLSAIFAFINKDRYKTLIKDIYEPGNRELREQIATARQEITDLAKEKTSLEAQVTEKDNLIKELKEINRRLPDYSALTKASQDVMRLMSNNHTETMTQLTDLAKKIAGNT